MAIPKPKIFAHKYTIIPNKSGDLSDNEVIYMIYVQRLAKLRRADTPSFIEKDLIFDPKNGTKILKEYLD